MNSIRSITSFIQAPSGFNEEKDTFRSSSGTSPLRTDVYILSSEMPITSEASHSPREMLHFSLMLSSSRLILTNSCFRTVERVILADPLLSTVNVFRLASDELLNFQVFSSSSCPRSPAPFHRWSCSKPDVSLGCILRIVFIILPAMFSCLSRRR